jgi:RNA polymerase sigma factor (sigma-70 family)
MDPGPLRLLLRQLRQGSDASAGGALSDAELLDRFVRCHDEAAFEVLVWRHGTMVLGLCRRLLRHEHDAEDAFQATFLVLARKARSISKREALASWLYKVAYRIALAARAVTAARRAREQGWVEMGTPDTAEDAVWRDLRPVLDEEVLRLPEKYRAAFVLCCLEGKTNDEAAELLGCPKGTVLSRLARARERLRGRLVRRGVVLSAGVLAVMAANKGSAATVPAGLVETTLRAALAVAAGSAPAAVASGPVTALMEGALRTMFMTKLKLTVAVLLLAGSLLATAGVLGSRLFTPAVAQEAPANTKGPEPKADDRGGRDAAEPAKAEDPVQLAARRAVSERNLKIIGLALHNYHDVYGKLPPPAIYGKDGTALLSWRVAILPFIEEDNLFKQFKMDEAWDGPYNKRFLANMPKVYAPVGAQHKETDRTYYQAFVGMDAGFEPHKELRIPGDFSDGTSNILWIVEAGSPVPWTKPEDLPYVPDQALPKLGGLFEGNFNALFVDGDVKFLSGKADEKLLRAAITRNGGENFDRAKLYARLAGDAGGKLDAEQLSRLNARLKETLKTAGDEVAKLKEDLNLLQTKLERNVPELDDASVKLLLENAELEEALGRLLAEIDKLKADKAHLQQEVQKRLKEKK